MGIYDAAPFHLSAPRRSPRWATAAGRSSTGGASARTSWSELEREPFAEAGGSAPCLDDRRRGPRAGGRRPPPALRVTTFDPDTLERDNRVLAALRGDRENLFGVYARVVRPGWGRRAIRSAASVDRRGILWQHEHPPRGGAVW